MPNTLDIVNNQLLQEGISSNPFLRRQALRKASEDTTYDEAPQQAVQPSTLKSINQNGTLADTYSTLLNNYNASSNSNSYNQSDTEDYTSGGQSFTIPGWAPTATYVGFGLGGLPTVGALGSAVLSLAQGDTAGGAGKLASLFANNVFEGKAPGLGSLIGTLTSNLVKGNDFATTGKNLFNTGLGTLLSSTNPILGLGYGLARLFGLNVANGLSGMMDQRSVPYSSWKGSFFGGAGYTPQEGSYMSSGNNNYSPYGGAPLNTTPASYGNLDTSSGSGFNSANWGSGLSGTTNKDSGSVY